MGRISKTIYKEIDPKDFTMYDAGLNYFYINTPGISSDIDEEFIKYFNTQIKVRNNALKTEDTGDRKAKAHTAVFGISSMSDKAVLLCDLW